MSQASAQAEGFEPSRPPLGGLPAFQAGAINRSATPPRVCGHDPRNEATVADAEEQIVHRGRPAQQTPVGWWPRGWSRC